MNAINKTLWNDIKNEIKNKYNKRWNAFYSGLLVQEYRKRGGKFKGKKGDNELKRWYDEKWENINPNKNDVIIFRPTKKITKDTPLTADKISKRELNKKIIEKRGLKKNENLSKFV